MKNISFFCVLIRRDQNIFKNVGTRQNISMIIAIKIVLNDDKQFYPIHSKHYEIFKNVKEM